MRKIKECLRLKLDCGLSNELVARAMGLSKGVVSKYVSRASAQGLDWPMLLALDEAQIGARLCVPAPVVRGERVPIDLAAVHRDAVSLTADFKATDDDIFKFKYAPKVEDSSQITRDTDASGWEVTYTRKLPWDMTAGLGYKVDSTEFENLQPRRKDDNTTWALQFTRDFSKKYSMEIGFESRERESNIPGKDAENNSVYIGATYKF